MDARKSPAATKTTGQTTTNLTTTTLNIICNTEADVHAKHPVALKRAANREFIGCSGKLPGESSFIDRDQLKQNISYILTLQGDGHRVTREGSYIKCRCPFHDDGTPSFVIFDDQSGHCFGCRWHGDVIKYVREYHELDFVAALRWLASRADDLERSGSIKDELEQSKNRQSSSTGRKTGDADITRYIHRLSTDTWIRQRICELRRIHGGENWNPETLLRLAGEGSLGWAGDALAFIYPKGVKYRKWPHKEFIWEAEGPSIWRQHRIAGANLIILCESETDAISAVDSGIEEDDSTAVVAISGVNSFKGEWVYLFRGKTVTLAFDNDAAGQERVHELLPVFRAAGVAVKLPKFEEVGE